MKFDNPRAVTFKVDTETRTIRGLALPYNTVGDNGMGKWSFTKGTLTWDKVKLLNDHDWSQLLGTVELSETDEGLEMTGKIAKIPAGDYVLELAQMGALDGLSVGLGSQLSYETRDGINYPTAGTVSEVSTTPIPAFTDAAIRSVAASAAANPEGENMGETKPKTEETPTFSAEDGIKLSATVDALNKTVEELKAAKFPTSAGGAGATFEKVDEEPLYRFDGVRGKHEFSTDLKLAFVEGDSEAKQRLQEYMSTIFAITPSDVSALNPSRYRPELYVDYIEKAAPTYTALYSGGLTDATPFVIPKFNTASGLVGAHTSGVEPTPGSFSTTSQTVTPTIVSGRAEIPREIIDAGGNPQVSGLIWRQMNRAYAEALETEAAAVLNAATATELNGTALTGSTSLAGDIAGALAGVPFIDGGDLMDFFLGHIDLYKALGKLTDSTGRPMFPYLSPANAPGTVAGKFRRMDVDGYELVPAKSLGATTVNKKSYLGYSDAVHVWNSGPSQITYETVANVSIGLFGYKASAVTQASLLYKVTY